MRRRASILLLVTLSLTCLTACKKEAPPAETTAPPATEASTEADLNIPLNQELPTTEVLIDEQPVTVTVLESDAAGSVIGQLDDGSVYAQSASLPPLSFEYDFNSELNGQKLDNLIVQWCKSGGTMSDEKLLNMVHSNFEGLTAENEKELLTAIKTEYPQQGVQETVSEQTVANETTHELTDSEKSEIEASMDKQRKAMEQQAQNPPKSEYRGDKLTGYDESLAAELNIRGQ